MKSRVVFLLLIGYGCVSLESDSSHETSLQGDFSFYSDETAFRDEIHHAQEEFVLEQLRKEADYITLKDGQVIEGTINAKDIRDSFIMIRPLLQDTLFKADFDDIQSIDFYDE